MTTSLDMTSSLAQSRCAALERLCSEITSLPLPAAAPSSRASSEQRVASSPSPVLATDTATATPTAVDPALAAVTEEVPSKEDGEADPEKAVAVAGDEGTAGLAVAEGAVATDGEAAAVAPTLKSKWVPAPFGGTISTADLQRQVCARDL